MSERAPDRATLWNRIDAVRRALPPHREGSRRLSVDAFADRLGVDRGTVYRWQRKESAPEEESREKLAAIDPKGHPPEWFSVIDRAALREAEARVAGFGQVIAQLRADGVADDDALSRLEEAEALALRLLAAQGA